MTLLLILMSFLAPFDPAQAADSVGALVDQHAQQLQTLNQSYQAQVDEVSKENRKALRQSLDTGKPATPKSASPYAALEQQHQKELRELQNRQLEELSKLKKNQKKSDAAGGPTQPETHSLQAFESTPSQQPQMVIDGSNVPREIEFPGPARPKR